MATTFISCIGTTKISTAIIHNYILSIQFCFIKIWDWDHNRASLYLLRQVLLLEENTIIMGGDQPWQSLSQLQITDLINLPMYKMNTFPLTGLSYINLIHTYLNLWLKIISQLFFCFVFFVPIKVILKIFNSRNVSGGLRKAVRDMAIVKLHYLGYCKITLSVVLVKLLAAWSLWYMMENTQIKRNRGLTDSNAGQHTDPKYSRPLWKDPAKAVSLSYSNTH